MPNRRMGECIDHVVIHHSELDIRHSFPSRSKEMSNVERSMSNEQVCGALNHSCPTIGSLSRL